MPRAVATPAQTAQAQKEVGVSGKGVFGGAAAIRVGNEIGTNRIAGVRPLKKADRRLLNSGEPSVYIYGVAPFMVGTAKSAGRTYGMLPKRDKDPASKVSKPLEIPGALVRDYDAGNRFRQTYTELGVDIAEDILNCSKEMPGLPRNDLTGWGFFYLIGKLFEDLKEDEQIKILDEAYQKLEEKCRLKVAEADQWADNEITRRWITESYRQAAIWLAEERGDKEIYSRNWVRSRGRTVISKVEECKWCGVENKPGLPVCPNCKNILNQERYDELSAPKGKKSKPAADLSE
jgi:hypothetical protein